MNAKFIVCQACLSEERVLYSLRTLHSLLINEELIHLNINNDGGVCWECKRMIVKFSRFRKQVEFAQKSMLDEKLHNLTCLSNLSLSTTHTINYLSSPDPLNSETSEIESKEIKQEETEDSKVDLHFSNEDSPVDFETNVYVQENEIKKEIAVKKKGKRTTRNVKSNKKIKINSKIDYDEVKEKFVQVDYTEEEMLRNREEKRSHPNFKKLPYNCNTCVLGFTRGETYDLHMDKKHNKNIGQHICPVCQIRFTSPTSLTRHIKKHYHCYRCKLCSYETTELWSALSHCRSKHSEDSEDCIHCKQCAYVAKTPEELAEHSRTQHSLICNECGEKFKGPNTLKTHIRRIHGTLREHKCDSCPKAFRSRGRLEAHMTTHGAAAAARLAYCAACRVQYKNIYVYRNHLSTSANHSERRYHCKECDKKFASKVYYKRHYTFYHQKSSPFKCEQCNRLFISDWRLRHHRQMQHGLARTRNHACNVCGKKFFQRYKCDECPKDYSAEVTLRRHQLPHVCHLCAKAFTVQKSLTEHLSMHAGLRPHACALCAATFTYAAALTHNRLKHLKIKRNIKKKPKPKNRKTKKDAKSTD